MFDYTQEAAFIVTANKQLVDWLLSLNTHNRAVKPSALERLTDALRAGHWTLTNQGIGVTKTGFISDGQHRLESIKAAGYPPVRFVLVTGLEESAQAVVDRHARRSQSDVIKLMLNRTVTNQAVAAANVKLTVKSAGDHFVRTGKVPTEMELAEFIQGNYELLSVLLPATGRCRAPVTAALIDYALHSGVDRALDVAEKLKTRLGFSGSSDPVYRLDKWLDANPAAGGSAVTDAYAATVSACVAHSQGAPLQLLRPSGSWDRVKKTRPAN